MNEYELRIKIAKNAVKTVRKKTEYALQAMTLIYSPIVTMPDKWAFGVVGILDFVLTGDPNKILVREIREEVKTALSLNQKNKKESP